MFSLLVLIGRGLDAGSFHRAVVKGQDVRQFFPGGYGGEETPVPIPNTEVKLPSADGTAGESLRESRSLPGFFVIFYRFPGSSIGRAGGC